MQLDITDALTAGAERTFERNGLMFIAAYFLVNLTASIIGVRVAPGTGVASVYGPTTMLMLALLSIVLALVSLLISIAAVRTFVSDETQTVPDAYLRRNLGRAMLHLILGAIVFAVVVAAGIVLFVVPGIYLMVALFFWSVHVIVEDTSFVEAMQQSWDLTKGHKWRLFGLLLALVVINMVVAGISAALGPQTTVGMVVGQLLSAAAGTYVLATQARAYVQLTA